MTSALTDEQMTTTSFGPRRKKLKDPEMARCFSKSETQPTINLLGENAASFIDLFDSCHRKMTASAHNFQFCSQRFKYLERLIAGHIFHGFFNFLLFAASVYFFLEKQYMASILYICLMPFIPMVFALAFWLNNSELRDVNLHTAEFRRAAFLLVVELGKLKQRCEDVKGSLGAGLEKENVERLEGSIVNLLDDMERLADTVTPETMDNVQKDYVKVFNDLEKMKVRLSFYRATSDEKRTTT